MHLFSDFLCLTLIVKCFNTLIKSKIKMQSCLQLINIQNKQGIQTALSMNFKQSRFYQQSSELLIKRIYIRDVKDCTISRLSSMAMNMLFMMVRHAQKVKGEA